MLWSLLSDRPCAQYPSSWSAGECMHQYGHANDRCGKHSLIFWVAWNKKLIHLLNTVHMWFTCSRVWLWCSCSSAIESDQCTVFPVKPKAPMQVCRNQVYDDAAFTSFWMMVSFADFTLIWLSWLKIWLPQTRHQMNTQCGCQEHHVIQTVMLMYDKIVWLELW